MPYQPAAWMILPFALLLVMNCPGTGAFPQLVAEQYPKVALALGTISVIYYY